VSPTSGRRAAPRGTLTRDGIVTAAFEFVAAEGLHRFSMPRLAKRLGVGVTSIYWYVDNKDELLEAVAEQVADLIVEAEGPADPGDWDSRLAVHFREVRRILDEHPGFCDLVLRHGFPRTGRQGRAEDVGYVLSHPSVRAMVAAGAEVSTLPAQDGDPRVSVGLEGLEGVAQRATQLGVERVARLRPVQRDDHDVFDLLDGDGVVHRSSVSSACGAVARSFRPRPVDLAQRATAQCGDQPDLGELVRREVAATVRSEVLGVDLRARSELRPARDRVARRDVR
jgi:AcrR family transcriptional regulator